MQRPPYSATLQASRQLPGREKVGGGVAEQKLSKDFLLLLPGPLPPHLSAVPRTACGPPSLILREGTDR